MIVDRDEIIKILSAKKSGNRGWYLGTCPYCGKEQHLGIIFGDKISSFKCFKGCEEGNLYKLLLFIKRLDLIRSNRQVKSIDFLQKNSLEAIEEEIIEEEPLKEVHLPMGFVRIKENEYLEGRGFSKEQFEIFKIGVTKIHPILKKDYIIFVVVEEGKDVGFLSRSTKDKDTIKEINKVRKLKKEKPYLRWMNSGDTDFQKLLFGIDEVIPGETKRIILVEGVTSKANVDRQLNLYNSSHTKCLATFGKKVSTFQIIKLLNKEIEEVVLMFDTSDAVNQSKKYGNELEVHFKVKIAHIIFKNEYGEFKDPGELNKEEIENTLSTAEIPETFTRNKIQKRQF